MNQCMCSGNGKLMSVVQSGVARLPFGSRTLAVHRFTIMVRRTLLEMGWTGLDYLRKGVSPQVAGLCTQRWAREVVRDLNIELTIDGEVPTEPALLVGNHRSYMDVVAVAHAVPCTFMAKLEVARWPLIGLGARLGNSIFVSRADAASRRRARDQVSKTLKAGNFVTVYPEGTTSAGPGLLPFRPGVFAMAAREGFPVVPMAIEYGSRDDAFVGDDAFVSHFLRSFSRPRVAIRLVFGPRLLATDADELRTCAWNWVRQSLSDGCGRLASATTLDKEETDGSQERIEEVQGAAVNSSRSEDARRGNGAVCH